MVSSLTFAEITIPMYLTTAQGQGKFIGNIVATDTQGGLMLVPHLTGLTPRPPWISCSSKPILQ